MIKLQSEKKKMSLQNYSSLTDTSVHFVKFLTTFFTKSSELVQPKIFAKLERGKKLRQAVQQDQTLSYTHRMESQNWFIELLRVENTSKIIKSTHCSNTATSTTKPHP